MKVRVAFFHETGASVIVEANSIQAAKDKIQDELEENGTTQLEEDKTYNPVHRDYDVVDAEEIKIK